MSIQTIIQRIIDAAALVGFTLIRACDMYQCETPQRSGQGVSSVNMDAGSILDDKHVEGK